MKPSKTTKENEKYFIKNLSTGAKIYIDYYSDGFDETYPTYKIIFEDNNGRTILKTFCSYEGYSGDLDSELEFILRNIFDSLQKGKYIDFAENFY